MDGIERIDAWERSIAHRAEQARALARRASNLSATARSRDGLVEVTVDAEGQLTRLRLDERTRQQSSAATADAIMQTLQAAKDGLVRQFEEATAETVGADSETGRALNEAMRRRLGPPTEPTGGHR
ncbi:YbaB/EbfC family nucleoid-associated protein [Actinoplanes sp. TBRC 11911]|uniref:YbaB/EbfC family nucleoid-associated protein n=1 Tax=Actinoplanes sp. TBRC 11911 TaxID=2729386 RepID=UPI0028A002B1|nr:YbaB/EbfC family nucleoid-associated protein [Actinoplanes sp. TBRC 11911]